MTGFLTLEWTVYCDIDVMLTWCHSHTEYAHCIKCIPLRCLFLYPGTCSQGFIISGVNKWLLVKNDPPVLKILSTRLLHLQSFTSSKYSYSKYSKTANIECDMCHYSYAVFIHHLFPLTLFILTGEYVGSERITFRPVRTFLCMFTCGNGFT